jgi:putative phosphoribosyl transferase
MARFEDRREGGRALATALRGYAGRTGLLVLGLPRGGVPVAFEVAMALGAPLDVFVVRKLGMPGHEEFALGAIATGGIRVINRESVESLEVSEAALQAVIEREQCELTRRERLFRQGREAPSIAGRTVLLIDDGLATGATMRAAAEAIRAQRPTWLVAGTPVGSPEACAAMGESADEVVCALTPEPFRAVGLWYADFEQTSDDEVRELLNLAAQNVSREQPGESA